MKIPFLPYFIVSTKAVREEAQMMAELKGKADASEWLTSDQIPKIEQLIILLRQAKAGHSAKGRRKARRGILRKMCELKAMAGAA